MKIRMFTLPNLLTLCNLLCGSVGLYFCLGRGDLVAAFWLMAGAAVFDFTDGLAARLTGQYSALGKELDSLADMVSFGILPAGMLFTVFTSSAGELFHPSLGIVTVSLALFTALRLARFNIDESQGEEFRGLPSPASALLAGSVGWLFAKGFFPVHPVFVIVLSLTLSYLLICPLRMFALKFSDYSWPRNRVRYSFLIASAATVAVWHIAAIPFIITTYVLVSLGTAILCRDTAAGDTPRGGINPNE